MIRPRFLPVILTVIQIALLAVLCPSSHSGDWTVRRPQGTLKVADVYLPEVSARMNYAEGLVTVDKDNNLIPCLAEDWRWINDRTIEFKLREGVKFHNGEKFNADSVRVNWEQYREMDFPQTRLIGRHIYDSSFEMDNEYIVRFILPEPDGLAMVGFVFFHQFAAQFFKSHKFEEGNWGYLPEPGPWGTGPFKLVEGSLRFARFADRYVLEAHGEYWDRRYPKVKRLVFDNSFMGNRTEAMRLCRETEGNVDIVNTMRPLDTLKVAASPFAKVVKSRDVTNLVGFFNERKSDSKWRDIRLRKALNYSINREELQKYAAKGNAFNLGGSIPFGAYGHNPNLSLYSYDTDQAKALLREAGYPNGFDITIITFESWKLETLVLRRMLERIGLRVQVEVMDHAALLKKIFEPVLDAPPESQSWDIAILHRWDWAGHPAIGFCAWALLHESGYSWMEFDSIYEEKWREMASTVDQDLEEEKIRELEQYIYDRAHFLFLYSPLMLYAANKQVSFVPYKWEWMNLKETSVTENHWSVRDKTD